MGARQSTPAGRERIVPAADVSRPAIQGFTRRKGPWRHRPIGTSTEAVLGRPSTSMPFGNGDIRRGDIELARAKIDPASGDTDLQHAVEMIRTDFLGPIVE